MHFEVHLRSVALIVGKNSRLLDGLSEGECFFVVQVGVRVEIPVQNLCVD